jgi:Zn-dependent protease/CBS domain-containing protein
MSNVEEQERAKNKGGSPWSFRVARVAGIPIRIHFTFLLFLTWVAVVGRRQNDTQWPILVLAIFFCVLLHELGHALTAKKFGIPTHDITLYPIGGVAMLAKRPTPRQELWITLAGPMVNVVIALIVGVILVIQNKGIPTLSILMDQMGFLRGLFAANVILAVFNLVPAFPMDGGRILRAILALNIDEARATQIAGAIGQALAIGFGFYGLFTGNIIWMLIAFFVFLGAGQEVSVTVTRSMMQGHKVADAMQTRFRTIEHGATLQRAAEMLLEGSQQDFPVAAGEDIVGILARNRIIEGLARDGAAGYVAGVMTRELKTVHPNLPLEKTMELFPMDDPNPILVMDEDKLVGLLTKENLGEFIALEEARSRGRSVRYAD